MDAGPQTWTPEEIAKAIEYCRLRWAAGWALSEMDKESPEYKAFDQHRTAMLADDFGGDKDKALVLLEYVKDNRLWVQPAKPKKKRAGGLAQPFPQPSTAGGAPALSSGLGETGWAQSLPNCLERSHPLLDRERGVLSSRSRRSQLKVRKCRPLTSCTRFNPRGTRTEYVDSSEPDVTHERSQPVAAKSAATSLG